MKTNKYTTLLAAIAATLFFIPATSDAQDPGAMYRQARTAFADGDFETADTLLTQVIAAQPSYVPARALQAQVKQRLAAKGGGDSMEKKCAAVIIPKIDFEDAELKLALEAIAAAASDVTESDFRPNFILNGGDEITGRKVTLKLRNAPLTTILEYLGELASVEFRYERFAVVGTPRVTTEPATAPTPADPELPR